MSKAQYNAGTFVAQDGQVYELQMTSDGFLKVTSAGGGTTTVGGPAADDAAASGNPVPIGLVYRTVINEVEPGDVAYAGADRNGNIRVRLVGTAFTAANGRDVAHLAGLQERDVDEANSRLLGTLGWEYNGASLDILAKPNAVSRIVSAAATTNATVAKASAGNVHKVTLYNAAAALRYLKLYNKATAPTVGTDVPVWTEVLPASSKVEITYPRPLYFSAGISYALTTAAADTDTGALTLADVTGLNVAYS